MAFSTQNKVAQMPSDAPGGGLSVRDEDKDFYIGSDVMVEIYYIVNDGGAAAVTLATGFNQVQGGYFFNGTDNVASSVIDVKPNQANPSVADISGIPLTAKTYIAVIYGDKNPNQLV